jgi:AcrR family transcriptional regulator
LVLGFRTQVTTANELELRPQSITKEMIVDAALSVIHAKGIAGATTRAIVQAVPCSEGSLYVHFTDRTQVFVAVIRKVVSGFSRALSHLDDDSRDDNPAEVLVSLMLQGLQFYRAAMPVLAGVMSDPQVLRAQQEALSALDRGPKNSRSRLATFIAGQISAGRLPSLVDAQVAAAMILYAAFGRAFEEHFTGRRGTPGDARFCKGVIASILRSESEPGR